MGRSKWSIQESPERIRAFTAFIIHAPEAKKWWIYWARSYDHLKCVSFITVLAVLLLIIFMIIKCCCCCVCDCCLKLPHKWIICILVIVLIVCGIYLWSCYDYWQDPYRFYEAYRDRLQEAE